MKTTPPPGPAGLLVFLNDVTPSRFGSPPVVLVVVVARRSPLTQLLATHTDLRAAAAANVPVQTAASLSGP